MLNDFAKKLVVSSSDFSRIYSTPSYNHFANYSTIFLTRAFFNWAIILFILNVLFLCFNLLCFNTHPGCSPRSSLLLSGYLTLSYLFPLAVVYSRSQFSSRHLFFLEISVLIFLSLPLKFQAFLTIWCCFSKVLWVLKQFSK